MTNKKRISTALISAAMLTTTSFFLPAKSAEKITFISGAFTRTISINNLETLGKTREVADEIESLIKLTNQDVNKVSSLLNQEYEIPLVLTSKLMYSKIGEVIVKRIAKILYPLKVPESSVSVPAIRSAVIKCLYERNDKINLISFLKAYPKKDIAITISELYKVINKVESMADLIRFFSNSPLENLKQVNPKV